MTPGGPLAYFQRADNDPSRYVSSTIFALMTVLGDAFMVRDLSLTRFTAS